MNLFNVLLLAIYGMSPCMARILNERISKVDPVYLDNILTEIVDDSMETMRQKLREAIYKMAIKKASTPSLFQHDAATNTSIQAHEDWLLDRFIADLAARRATPDSSPIVQAVDAHSIPQRDTPLPQTGSHTMSIALETYTIHPKEVRGKLITAPQIDDNSNELDFDQLRQPLHDDHKDFTSIAAIPFWLTIGFSLTVCVFAIILIICVISAHYKRKNRFKKVLQMPDPMTITGFNCPPECHHFPSAAIARMGRSASLDNQRHGAVWPGGYERTFRR